VWEDTNANGIQDANESGIKGVHVELYDANGDKVAQTDTNATGEYKLCAKPGDYHIKVTPPAGYVVSPKDMGKDDSKDSDIDPKSNESENTHLDSAEDDTTWDAGLYKPACIGDYVWKDTNANGLQDNNEKPIEGVQVTLKDRDGNSVKDIDGADVSPKTTDANGAYKFCNLKPGDYKVEFKANPDSDGTPYISTKNENSDDSKNSDIAEYKVGGGESKVVTLKSGDNYKDLDAGFIQEICLGDTVWEDENGNGVQDANETKLPGVTVSLLDANGNKVKDTQGNEVADVVTKADGKYQFCHLKPAVDYKVVFKTTPGYYPTYKDRGGDDSKDSDIDSNKTISIEKAKVSNDTLDAGFVQPACLGDYVWEDKNANGIQDAGESGIEGVEVELFKADGSKVVDINGNVVNAKTTNSNGEYKFCNLMPGDYKVKINTPSDEYYLTYKDKGADDAKDSDINPTTKESSIVSLRSGDDYKNLDAGVFKPACLGDYIWEDKNANGIQDANEKALSGVKVELKSVDGADVVDVEGNAIEMQTTDSNGTYKFCNLRPGSYVVDTTMPEDYYITKANEGSNDSKDSDLEPTYSKGKGSTKAVTLQSGEDNLTIDGGAFKTSCVGSAVWLDKNGNGIQEANEPGVANVTITLLDKDGNSGLKDIEGNPISELVTGEDGKYEFCNLIPGTYRVKFEAKPENGAPYVTTGSKKGDEQDDSDIPEYVLNGGVTEPITLEGGQSYQAVKAGFVQEICLGGDMWYDKNLNGIEDEKNLGVVDIPVYLYEKDGKTIAKDVYGNPVKATKTDAKGRYKFCHIQPARDYVIKVATPDSYMPTLKDRGANDAKDSELRTDSTIYVKNPVKDDLSLNSGIYCECDDYNVHPENRKKMSAPAFSFVGFSLAFFALLLIALRKEKRA
jgi:protocatechuate 3,4-dioxygenase beta subunit